MVDIRIDYETRTVDFYNVPNKIKRAIETLLYEVDEAISAESEKE